MMPSMHIKILPGRCAVTDLDASIDYLSWPNDHGLSLAFRSKVGWMDGVPI